MSTPEAQALVELAAKVEAAKGPDRELDLLIAQRFDPDWQGIYPGNFAGYVKHGQHPAYTASIDAAMTLVLAAVVGWRMDWSGRRAIVRMGLGGNPETAEAWAATPALALCAASLRALSLIEATHGEGGVG